MRIANNLPQNSAEWLKWRQSGLGASDAPVVMGVSPFTTRFELWLDKTGKFPRSDSNFHPNALKAMTRGHLLEPQARQYFEGFKFRQYPPMNVIHEKYDFIRASLDGYNAETNRIVEIKCPGKVDLAEAAKGRVPKKYLPQVQLQLMVTGAAACDYFTYDGEKGIIIEVLPDLEYQARLEKEMVAFWELVQKKIVPSLSFKDVLKSVKALSIQVGKLNGLKDAAEIAVSSYQEQSKEEK